MPRASVMSDAHKEHRFLSLCVIEISDPLMKMIKMLCKKDEEINKLQENAVTNEARAAVVAMTMGVQINNLQEKLAQSLSTADAEESHEEVIFV